MISLADDSLWRTTLTSIARKGLKDFSNVVVERVKDSCALPDVSPGDCGKFLRVAPYTEHPDTI